MMEAAQAQVQVAAAAGAVACYLRAVAALRPYLGRQPLS